MYASDAAAVVVVVVEAVVVEVVVVEVIVVAFIEVAAADDVGIGVGDSDVLVVFAVIGDVGAGPWHLVLSMKGPRTTCIKIDNK